MNGAGGSQWLAMAFAQREGGYTGAASLRIDVEQLLDPSCRVVRARDWMVTAVREGDALENPQGFVEAKRRVLAARLGGAVSAGLGTPRAASALRARDQARAPLPPEPLSRGLHVAALQAEQALLLGRALRGDGRTTAFSELGPYCFVLGQPLSDLSDFCARALGPLADDERHEDLVRTLEAYLRNHGSLNAVARELYLHRNTVRQRLRRIATLTGADLHDPDARLALHLAVLGRRAIAELSVR
jgi:hypothetical protein